MGRPPFTRWSDTDHSGPIIITTVLGLVYWLVPGVGQQVISFGQSSSFSWADGLYTGSMVMGLAQALLLLIACSRGLGRSTSVLNDAQVIDALRLYHASNILYVLVMGFAKCSATSSIIKLTVPNRGSIRGASVKHKTVFGVVTGLGVAWTVGSVIALGLQCEVGSTPSSQSNTCDGSMTTWVGIFVSDGVTDLVIAAFAASIIWPTKALVRLKLLWYMPFTIRLCVIILSGVRLAAYYPAQLSKDPTIAIWLFVILTQIQIFVSLIAAGFPALRKTVLDLVTNFGVSEDSKNRSGNGAAYILSSLTRKSRQKQSQYSSSAFSPYTGSKARANTVINAGTNTQLSDDNSQKGIIRQDEYDVVVTTVDHDR